MKKVILGLLLTWMTSLKAQEPDRVKIMHADEVMKEVFAKTFNKEEMKKALTCSFLLEAKIKGNGQICDARIVRPDSNSIVFQKREKLLRIIKQKINIEYYSKSFQNWISQNRDTYCISALISKGVIFDYENEPFKCSY
jgi:hypothetical protein